MKVSARARTAGRAALLALLLLVSACSGANVPATAPTPTPEPPPPSLAGLALTGDPAASSGAAWTYQATDAGIAYDLTGTLHKPAGAGPFPAVILSHGAGGSVNGLPRLLAGQMLTWGLVCIATNYTHAGNVPPGAPGTEAEPGASQANVLRGRKLLDILAALGYVDMRRVAAHGHSAGAFLTAALVGAYPDAFRVASQTAGGVGDGTFAIGAMATTEGQARGIRAPYQIHHGALDEVVPLSFATRLAAILETSGVAHELIVYPAGDHEIQDPTVLTRVRAWYAAHGLFE